MAHGIMRRYVADLKIVVYLCRMKTGSYRYTVQPRDVDMTKRATIITLSDYILHAAGADADKNGFGIRILNEHNWTWVLSRLAVEVERLPEEYEEFEVATWVENATRIMTTRNFIITDNDGKELAKATSLWAMIDTVSRLPQDLSLNLDYANIVTGVPCPIEKPVKIGKVEGEAVLHHKVAYSDIDFNQHANSMKYLQWMIDSLPLEKLISSHIRRIDVNFTHETLYGQDVSVYAYSKDGCDTFEVRHSDGTPACKAVINWK